MNLSTHYDQMNISATRSIVDESYTIDHFIGSPTDTRCGLTLLFRLDEPLYEVIQNLKSNLISIEPDQYYYPRHDLHVTVLSIISCYEGFKLSRTNRDEYIKVLRKALLEFKGFSIRFRGVALSNTGVLLTGFPDPSLNQIRDNLREGFNQTNLEHSIDSRYALKTAHCTFMRYREKLSNKASLFDFVLRNRYKDFGTMKVKSLDFVFNDWYQTLSKTEILSQFQLGR